MLKAGKSLKAAAVLMALVLVMIGLPMRVKAASMSQFYGLWKGESASLMLHKDGTGVWYSGKNVEIIKWRNESGTISMTFPDGTWDVLEFKNGSTNTIEVDRGSRWVKKLYYLKRVDTRTEDHTGVWAAGSEKLYLMSNGTYTLKSGGINSTGSWLEGGEAVFLLKNGSTEVAAALKDDGARLHRWYGNVSQSYFSRQPEPAVGSKCTLCAGAKQIYEDCPDCTGGTNKCSKCNGTTYSRPCMTCGKDGKIEYSMDMDCATCKAFGRDRNCSKCHGRGTYEYSWSKTCYSCNGTGGTRCTTCNAKGYMTCKKCSGKGGKSVSCSYCGGSGLAATSTPKPTATPTPRPTATPGPRITFTQKNGASCSGAAWNAASPSCGKDVLKKLTRNYALEITFSASGSGHVWICLPQSKAGWTGIGQQSPIIRGNKVIIPYDAVVKAAGSSSSWGSQLYIKGSTDWKVTQIRVIYWPD